MSPSTIRELRACLGLTQARAAALFGVDHRTWVKWEGAERSMPGPAQRLLLLIARYPDSREHLESLTQQAAN